MLIWEGTMDKDRGRSAQTPFCQSPSTPGKVPKAALHWALREKLKFVSTTLSISDYMWRVFCERFLQTSSSSSDLTEGPECPCGLARKERATQTHGRSTSLSGREEADIPWRTRPIRRCESMKRKHLRYSYGFSSGHVWMWELDQKGELSAEELMLLNCGVEGDSWQSPIHVEVASST